MKTSAVNLHAITKRYRTQEGSLLVFEDLNLQFEDGKITCIVGPSGCGKSTLLMCIAGLEPYEGEISIGGDKIAGPGSDRGLVFQSYAMVPWRSVLHNITIGLELRANRQPRHARESIARSLVELTGLSGFESAYPDELSGGMKQRVAIARALATQPSLLLMDEPFGALDALTRRRMGEELIHIWRQDKPTIIFITHSVEEALAIGDRILVCGDLPMSVMKDIRPSNPQSGGPPEEHEGLKTEILSALGFQTAPPV